MPSGISREGAESKEFMMRFCLFLALLFLPNLVWAEEHHIIFSGEVLRGSFSQERRLKDFKAPLRSTGNFVIAPSHGLIWSVKTPFPIITVITPKGLVQEVEGNQTMNLPAQKIPFLLHLYDMLSGTLAGDWSSLAKEFTINKTGDEQKWKVQLLPLKTTDETSMPFSSITATGSKFIEKIELNRADGDSDYIIFHNQKLSTDPLTEHELKMLP